MDVFDKLQIDYLSGGISGSALVNKLKDVAFSQKIETYICEVLESEGVELDPMLTSFILRCIYVKPLKIFCSPLVAFLEMSRGLDDDELFKIICEVEFSFCVLGLIKDRRAVPILQSFVDSPVSWDEGNISDAAKYSISTILTGGV